MKPLSFKTFSKESESVTKRNYYWFISTLYIGNCCVLLDVVVPRCFADEVRDAFRPDRESVLRPFPFYSPDF